MRKFLAILLAAVFVAGLLPMALAADSDFVIEDGMLVEYTGPGGDVVIPDGVTEIFQETFWGRDDMTSVTIPDSVTWISYWAFAQCTGLTNVTIPGSVTTICNFAFENCTGLTSITIPDSVTDIYDDAFMGCDNLTIYGVAGSAAETYAKENDVPFVAGQAPAGPSAPTEAPVEPPVASNDANTAYASTQAVDVDGKDVTFECYALKNENGNMTNYIKLRDLAMLLNGTAAQFEVGWNGDVTITTQTAYTPNGSELSTPFSGNRTYQTSDAATKVDGETVQINAFVLKDDAGGGHTYYQLRDLGKVLDFNVGWTAERGMFLETGKPYDPNN